jgi:maltooligosyltrehalose trehalohydrolase
VLASAPAIDAALQIMLLAPTPPMLFMGEEWGAVQPFPFFCDFGGELADAVRRGRKAEFAAAYSDLTERALPDPMAEGTFRSAVLDWSALDRSPHKERLPLVRKLLALRREHVTPRLRALRRNDARADWRDGVISAQWRLGDGSRLVLVANVGEQPKSRPPQAGHGRAIWGGAPPPELPPWSVFWSVA